MGLTHCDAGKLIASPAITAPRHLSRHRPTFIARGYTHTQRKLHPNTIRLGAPALQARASGVEQVFDPAPVHETVVMPLMQAIRHAVPELEPIRLQAIA